MIDRDKLAALHERATKGDWEAHQGILAHQPSMWDVTSTHGWTPPSDDCPKGYFLASLHDIGSDGDDAANAALIALLCSESARQSILNLIDENKILWGAIMAVIAATREYLPPDGIDAQECINRILEATDNQDMARLVAKHEEDRDD